jgi:hypothetical protein
VGSTIVIRCNFKGGNKTKQKKKVRKTQLPQKASKPQKHKKERKQEREKTRVRADLDAALACIARVFVNRFL